jgi:hypothetical protein
MHRDLSGALVPVDDPDEDVWVLAIVGRGANPVKRGVRSDGIAGDDPLRMTNAIARPGGVGVALVADTPAPASASTPRSCHG